MKPQSVYRHLDKDLALDALIEERAAKLERFCSYIMSCRVAVEMTQHHHKKGNPYRIRIDLHIPKGHELDVTREAIGADGASVLPKLVRESFDAAERQLVKFMEKHHSKTMSL
ncbi:MAG: ribosome-associated protein [Candidatus Omnitrophica bacterium CG11_big_fil_rev_8_21_14_0_20_45_26]|uniref:Ribosome-associated protein n=1 Tax=Candidatus Abzuiibacterium crystallinum TaxID=1974748 RepID=A0A2H0LPZ1_9BACT|nr:MAG: ribosome-associated protein [Candidatus Omnitrophica bacterium CG11_big_fil_rev_8_21_14_0_20_45_26]PIW63746.1 MAG: ribosome-associated protein [Candidatus Omnitrophica bacterium CG12_big_fil_rev_8_21_14_0_65_45_16]